MNSNPAVSATKFHTTIDAVFSRCINSIDTGPSHTSLKAKDDSRPNVTLKFPPPLSLSVIDFTPAARAFFVRVARLDVFGEEGSFLTIRTMPAVIVVFEGESEFPLSLIEELTFPYFEVPLFQLPYESEG
ncbi:hypothetical protein AVEN_184259-1 [Araneus ventricosus]|uniref:Uncharacterized protein n=1 Tax=Araneus ventricosus TaxID=182803 RepID=A0A4Y2GPU2_ARAVE|nr:hypothetical protein AVEN_184259-1 [Araneus ventricosus]